MDLAARLPLIGDVRPPHLSSLTRDAILRGLVAFRWVVGGWMVVGLASLAGAAAHEEVGDELYSSAKTMENHVRNIVGKLHLSRKQELIRYALEHGIE